MKWRWIGRRRGFTLVEIILAVGLSGMILGAMLMTLTTFLNLQQSVNSSERQRLFDEEVIATRTILNEIAVVMRRIPVGNNCEQMTFKELGKNFPQGGKQVDNADLDPEEVAFYWQSDAPLPFVDLCYGGLTEYFLKFEKQNEKDLDGVLRLYYRSLGPKDKPRALNGNDGSGDHWEDHLKYVTLLSRCEGLNYGYKDALVKDDPKITFQRMPKIVEGKGPILPEMIQILVPDAV
ncbi:MAG: type II secretion system GspH family protein [Opitutales bacterium]|nr:type II secretion system GspH family protein [Opitutales bacterium]